MSGLPWIRGTTPVHANKEYYEAYREKENANPVEGFELFQL
jgi:hypothetical protein